MSQNLIHLITATKYRRSVDEQVAAYIETDVLRVMGWLGVDVLAAGFDNNHLHVLFNLPATHRLADIARRLKACTSKHVRRQFPRLISEIKIDALWQRRYLYISLGSMGQAQTTKYIQQQAAFRS